MCKNIKWYKQIHDIRHVFISIHDKKCNCLDSKGNKKMLYTEQVANNKIKEWAELGTMLRK